MNDCEMFHNFRVYHIPVCRVNVPYLGSRVQPGDTPGSRESRDDHGPTVGVGTLGSSVHYVRRPTGDERLIAGR